MDQLKDEILVNYLLGKCTEAENEEILAWMKQSEDNASRLFKLEELYHLGKFAKYEDEERVERAERHLQQRLDGGQSSAHSFFGMRRLLRYAAVVAVLCILGGVGGYIYHHIGGKSDMVIASADSSIVKEIVLPDGTCVWLNRLATLTYPRHFDSAERHVELKGEAYFEVTKNPHQPFIVNSEAMSVRVLGTHFNFNTDKPDHTTEVSLLEGSVQAKGNDDEGMITLRPGQKAILNKLTHEMTVQQTETPLDAVWHDNLIPLKNVNIKDIAGILEYFYHVHISFASNVDTRMTYSGVIKRNATIDSVLTDLSYAIPFHFTIQGENIYLSRKK
jgi:transmembrane sensor